MNSSSLFYLVYVFLLKTSENHNVSKDVTSDRQMDRAFHVGRDFGNLSC